MVLSERLHHHHPDGDQRAKDQLLCSIHSLSRASSGGATSVLLFVGAVIMRLRRGEKVTIVVDLVYLAMAAFVAWGRFGPESFTG